ncbi:methyltransferase domain-containing protein [Trichlorobacter ammonificans]|uniref:Methyltransf_11 domain-containing protein n=1 Tax=Trichlorobacter ammonificans TaxID=2916410 RepID=A0ABM9DBN8_9BACT|nr:methyltransferase domain-containing protein [Trichlorobacter ammonificans]CAH2032605.1 Methyltransf_11 domain-containing protein [Trichlorobacter ammonificans]
MTNKMRRLHIGGVERKEGWELLNIFPSEAVDHVGDARDLSRFADSTFYELYASHVLEHFDFTGELLAVLKEWLRVLVPGGRLYLSVPDMDVLCALFLCKEALSVEQRFHLTRMMFGAHCDRYDYHLSGLNREFLEQFLRQAGFATPLVVTSFNLFNDTSTLTFEGVPISLNMIAKKPFHP